MARLAKHMATSADVDRYHLAYLERAWLRLPDVEGQWGEMQEPERLDFVLEWPIKEDRLAQLRSWVAEGVLTPQQMDRYRELLALVEKHRPILERLLSEDDPTIPRRNARGASA